MTAAASTATVEQSCQLSPKIVSAEARMPLTATPTPPGAAVLITVLRKSPSTRSLLGSSARKKAGMPMVRDESRVS